MRAVLGEFISPPSSVMNLRYYDTLGLNERSRRNWGWGIFGFVFPSVGKTDRGNSREFGEKQRRHWSGIAHAPSGGDIRL
jgi:hypothetical protein